MTDTDSRGQREADRTVPLLATRVSVMETKLAAVIEKVNEVHEDMKELIASNTFQHNEVRAEMNGMRAAINSLAVITGTMQGQASGNASSGKTVLDQIVAYATLGSMIAMIITLITRGH